MEFVSIDKDLPKTEGKYIVRTKTKYTHGNVIEIRFHYDTHGKPHWDCHNQLVIEWLKN